MTIHTKSIQATPPLMEGVRLQPMNFEHKGVEHVATPAGFQVNGCEVYDIYRGEELIDGITIGPMEDIVDVITSWKRLF